MRATPRSLSTRLILAMVLVALVSAVLSGLLAAPLLSSATQAAVRQPLGRQADLLARLPQRSLLSQRINERVDSADLVVGSVDNAGRVTGAAAALTPEEVDAVLAGRSVSAVGELAGTPMALEARPSRGGGGVVVAASTESIDAASDRLRNRVLLAIAIGLAVAVAVAWLMAARLSVPLTRAATAARRLAAGERGVELPEELTEEVADVVDALRHLDRALATSEQRQRQFLLSVSHELRTPLTAVRGYAEAMVDGAVTADELPALGATLRTEALRLERYVADLLALARLEADDFSWHPAEVDLGELLGEAVGAWSDRAARAEVEVTLDRPASGPVVVSDASRLRQVLDVLLDNAVRVCPRGSVIGLAVVPAADGATIRVRDNGPGLTEADLADAFEPGVLHDRYAGSRPGGAGGLGLAIAYRLVGRIGGTIHAAPAGGGGAEFTIGLPARPGA